MPKKLTKENKVEFLDQTLGEGADTARSVLRPFLGTAVEPAEQEAVAPPPVPEKVTLSTGEVVKPQEMSPVAGFVRGLGQGLSADLMEEVVGSVPGDLTKEDYQKLYQAQAAGTPKAYGAGKVTGTALGVGKLMKILGGGPAASTAEKALRGAGVGGAYAGTSAIGKSKEDLVKGGVGAYLKMLREAAPQAAMGTVLGAAGGVAPITTSIGLGGLGLQAGLTDKNLTPAEQTEAILGGVLGLAGGASAAVSPPLKYMGRRAALQSLGGGAEATTAVKTQGGSQELGQALLEKNLLPIFTTRRNVAEKIATEASKTGRAKTKLEQELDALAGQREIPALTREEAAARGTQELLAPRREYAPEYTRINKELQRLQGKGAESQQPLTLQELTRMKNEIKAMIGPGAYEGESGFTKQQLEDMQSYLIRLQNEAARTIAQEAGQPKTAQDYMRLKEEYGLMQDLKDISQSVAARGEARGLFREPLNTLLESEALGRAARATARGLYAGGQATEALGQAGLGAQVGGPAQNEASREQLVRAIQYLQSLNQ